MTPRIAEWLSQPRLILKEEFDWGAPDSAVVSTAGFRSGFGNTDLVHPGWTMRATISNGSAIVITGVTNRVGVWLFSTGATINSGISLHYSQGLTPSSALAGFASANIQVLEWLVSIDSATSISFVCGLTDDWTALTGDSAYFNYNPTISANWRTLSINSAGGTTTTTSTLPVTLGYHTLTQVHVLQPAEQWKFYIDGVLISTHSVVANLPTGLVMPGILVQANAASVRTFSADDCQLWVDGKQLLL